MFLAPTQHFVNSFLIPNLAFLTERNNWWKFRNIIHENYYATGNFLARWQKNLNYFHTKGLQTKESLNTSNFLTALTIINLVSVLTCHHHVVLLNISVVFCCWTFILSCRDVFGTKMALMWELCDTYSQPSLCSIMDDSLPRLSFSHHRALEMLFSPPN
jgi:hypothetical protein